MIPIESAYLKISAASHPGMSGKKNEDRYQVISFMTGKCLAAGGDPAALPAVLAVVCDGIGGHRAGEVAAQMGVGIITQAVRQAASQEVACDEPDQDSGLTPSLNPLEIIDQAVKQANHAIYQASLSDQGRKGMGATCACAWVIDDRLYTANLGDSRIYLLRGGHILQLSTDHTWLQEAFDAGIIDEVQGDTHPNAHVIRRYLGSEKPPKLDFRLWFYEGEGDAEALENQGLQLEPGDIVLICSDGLTDLVSDDEIRKLVSSQTVEQASKALIDLTNGRGGHDNTTVVLMAMPPSNHVKGGNAKPVRKKRGLKDKGLRRRWVFGLLAILIMTGLLLAGINYGMRWWGARPLPVTSTATPVQVLPLATETVIITVTEVHTMTPGATLTPATVEDPVTPPPTLTPWPTHTTTP